MNALTTALRVLRWTLDAGTGRAPAGPLRQTAGLIEPGHELRDVLSALLRRHAARTGAGRPPLGDPTPPGAGAVLLAAAIGGRGEWEAACAVAEAVRPPRLSADDDGWSDALARHAVVSTFASLTASQASRTSQTPQTSQAPTSKSNGSKATPPAAPRPELGPEHPAARILEPLLDASPLTAVLHRPSAGRLSEGAGGAVRTATALLDRPHGPAVLRHALASWTASAAVLDWRCHLLARLATDHPEAVVDTYLAARLRHGTLWDEQVDTARRRLAGREPPDDLTVATVRFWAPLALLDRRHRGLLATRPYLAGHQPALRLVNRYRLTPPTVG